MSSRCQDTQKLLQPYLDGEFDGGEKSALEAHLADCKDCQSLANSELGFRKAMREARRLSRKNVRSGGRPSGMRLK